MCRWTAPDIPVRKRDDSLAVILGQREYIRAAEDLEKRDGGDQATLIPRPSCTVTLHAQPHRRRSRFANWATD